MKGRTFSDQPENSTQVPLGIRLFFGENELRATIHGPESLAGKSFSRRTKRIHHFGRLLHKANNNNNSNTMKHQSNETESEELEPEAPKSLEMLVREQAEIIKQIQQRLDYLEADEDKHYPHDTYSLISLNSPDEEGRLDFFLFGVVVWAFQMVFITLLTLTVFTSFYDNEEYRDGDAVMAVTEFAAILGFCFIPDASPQDVVTAKQLWPCKHGTVNVMGRKIACTFRFIQGASACVCVLFLINISPNAIDIILNFAALNFVSDMDSVAFELAAKGVFGKPLQEECERIMDKDLPETVGDKHKPYRTVMFVCAASMLIINSLLMSHPEFTKRLYTTYTDIGQSE